MKLLYRHQTAAQDGMLLRDRRLHREEGGSAEGEVALLARPSPVIEEHGTSHTASDNVQPTAGCDVRRHTNVAAAR
jgi:hypothetical protein